MAPDTVEKFITEIATIIQRNLTTFLAGSDEAWRAAERLAAEEARDFTAGIEARQLRRRAEAARATGDWQTLGATYERLLASGVTLTPAEQSRLMFAHKNQKPA